jgi:hypothetical protein
LPPQAEPTAHYRAANIHAVGEWAHRRIVEAGVDGEGNPLADEEIIGIADWCFAWIENDPGDNGGDRTVRRGMRRYWPQVFAEYRSRRSEAPAD